MNERPKHMSVELIGRLLSKAYLVVGVVEIMVACVVERAEWDAVTRMPCATTTSLPSGHITHALAAATDRCMSQK